MNRFLSDRRLACRSDLAIRLSFRILKSGIGEQCAESMNVSKCGVYFTTGAPLAKGAAVELLLTMPEEITGKPATVWRCTGHVVRVQPMSSPQQALGVGVRFDCYEILQPSEKYAEPNPKTVRARPDMHPS